MLSPKIISVATLLSVTALPANAALIAAITGASGSDQTTWTFSGSDIAGGGGLFEDEDNLGFQAWQNVGEYTDAEDFENLNILSGVASITIGTETREIDLTYLDSDSGVDKDDFGVGVMGTSDFTFALDDTVSWTGSIVVGGIDIDDIDNGGLPSVFTTSNYGGAVDTLDLELRIGVSPIPLPASALLLGFAVAGLGAVGRRRRG